MHVPSDPGKDDVLVVPPPSRAWVVLHTRPRCEKRIADFCERNTIDFYLPLRRKKHRYGARERVFWSPLFPGYVFCVVTVDQRMTFRQNRHVANLLEVLDQAKLVEQLRQIRQALETGDLLEVLPYLEVGKRVLVTGGPLKGAEGYVQRIKGKDRVIINVDMIRQSVAVEVDNTWLSPV
ncbi:MAG: transcription termination/antitermination NusG family protein [Pseudomonadota bacterium]